jgi:hypothetical protein
MKPTDLLLRLADRFPGARLVTELHGLRSKEITTIEVRTHEHDLWRPVGALVRRSGRIILDVNPRAEPRDVTLVLDALAQL